MSTYTMSDVQEADRLWDEMPQSQVAEATGVPLGTIKHWARIGLISTEVNHNTKYDAQTISRADELYDVMPLKQLSDVLGVPKGTLAEWSSRGWISTERETGNPDGRDAKVNPRLLVEAYFEDESITMKEVGEEFGVSRQTVGYHVQKYRSHDL